MHHFVKRLPLIGGLILLVGLVLWGIGMSYPVYTDVDAPGRLSLELDPGRSSVLPGSSSDNKQKLDDLFKQFYARLAPYETPHKFFADLGRGVLALGLGILIASAGARFYLRSSKPLLYLGVAWCSLWALRIPFLFWYYTLRFVRFDYPVWGIRL